MWNIWINSKTTSSCSVQCCLSYFRCILTGKVSNRGLLITWKWKQNQYRIHAMEYWQGAEETSITFNFVILTPQARLHSWVVSFEGAKAKKKKGKHNSLSVPGVVIGARAPLTITYNYRKCVFHMCWPARSLTTTDRFSSASLSPDSDRVASLTHRE